MVSLTKLTSPLPSSFADLSSSPTYPSVFDVISSDGSFLSLAEKPVPSCISQHIHLCRHPLLLWNTCRSSDWCQILVAFHLREVPVYCGLDWEVSPDSPANDQTRGVDFPIDNGRNLVISPPSHKSCFLIPDMRKKGFRALSPLLCIWHTGVFWCLWVKAHIGVGCVSIFVRVGFKGNFWGEVEEKLYIRSVRKTDACFSHFVYLNVCL